MSSRLTAEEALKVHERINMITASISMMVSGVSSEQIIIRTLTTELETLQALLASDAPKPRPARVDDDQEDDDLAYALALSLSLSGPDVEPRPNPAPLDDGFLHDAVERRKALEEADTRAVLGDVRQHATSWAREIDGTIRVGASRYRSLECGASHGGHSNLCCYMSLEQGNGDAAVALKAEIAPIASEFSRRIGAHVDYCAASAMADTEVIRAYVKSRKTPVCVVSAAANAATVYSVDAPARPCVYLYLSGAHYTRLTPA